jgi:hypothetical protein
VFPQFDLLHYPGRPWIERYEVISYMSARVSLWKEDYRLWEFPWDLRGLNLSAALSRYRYLASFLTLFSPSFPSSCAHTTTMTPRPWKTKPIPEMPSSSSTANLLLRDSKRTSDVLRIDSWGTFSVRRTRFYFCTSCTNCNTLDGYSIRSRSRVNEFQAVIHHRQG